MNDISQKCQHILSGFLEQNEQLKHVLQETESDANALRLSDAESLFLAVLSASSDRSSLLVWTEPLAARRTHVATLRALSAVLGYNQRWHLLTGDLTDAEYSGTALSEQSQTIRHVLNGTPGHHFLVSGDDLQTLIPDPESFVAHQLHVTVGEPFGYQALVSWLASAQYERYTGKPERGGFSVRGEAIDVWPVLSDDVVTLTLLDDVIESIVTQSQQRTVAKNSSILSPVSFTSPSVPLEAVLGDAFVLTRNSATTLITPALDTDAITPTIENPFIPIDPEVAPTLVFYENHDRISYYLQDRFPQASVVLERSELGNHSFSVAWPGTILTTEGTLLPRAATPSPISRSHATTLIAELAVGKPAVHSDHGIGIYEGLQQRTLDQTPREYLVLRYAEGDSLSVPVEYAHKVTAYVGEEQPPIQRLHGSGWQSIKKQATHDAEAFARQLLQTAGRRHQETGHRYHIDRELEGQLKSSFPHTLTPDQEAAWTDIKEDLANAKPIDRLVVGDVGFGKTELAVRAAQHVVANGKQVAVLAPTTLLTQQHWQTFRDRLPHIQERIVQLSRFSTAKEQRVARTALAEGTADIAVGTHALLSKNTSWKNLGLVIVDEEQRFGVRQKEHFKKLRADIDVISLSATPIPRSLSMSLAGLRDLSVISTAPSGRQEVATQVKVDTDEVLAEALTRELERDGQAYVVAPKVSKLQELAARVQNLVPTARVAIAHGQMSSRQLEIVMKQFANGTYNVLVSSTIIESGLDLPRANTMIVTSATHFGLADLYQLRGRVGRRSTQAFAYFLYRQSNLTHDQRRRLSALVEASQIGAGWTLARRDLEIRGAGNLLGAEQSGSVNAVGAQLYLDLVREAAEKEGAAEVQRRDVEISLPLAASIPPAYIADEHARALMYQKLSRAPSLTALKKLFTTLTSSYGPLPTDVKGLQSLLKLQHAAAATGITRVEHQVITPVDEDRYHRLVVQAKNIPALLPALAPLGSWVVKDDALTLDVDAITPKLVQDMVAALT